MKYFLYSFLTLALVGCGIAKDAEDTLAQVKETNKNMQTTNDSLSEMKVLTKDLKKSMVQAEAFKALLEQEHGALLLPTAPLDIIPFAKKFAENSTAEELIQAFNVLITHAIKGFDSDASADRNLARRKFRYNAAGLIAAYAPRETVEEVIANQIERQGIYEDIAYYFLTLRYKFIGSVLVKPLLDDDKRANLEKLKEGVRHVENMRRIALAPYAAELHFDLNDYLENVEKDATTGQIKVVGYTTVREEIDVREYRRISRDLVTKYKTLTSEEALELLQSLKK